MYVLSFFRPRNSCSTELLGNPRHCRGGDVGGGGGYVHPWWLMDRNNREHHQSRHLNCAAETLVRRGLIPYCCSKIAQFVFLSKKKKKPSTGHSDLSLVLWAHLPNIHLPPGLHTPHKAVPFYQGSPQLNACRLSSASKVILLSQAREIEEKQHSVKLDGSCSVFLVAFVEHSWNGQLNHQLQIHQPTLNSSCSKMPW